MPRPLLLAALLLALTPLAHATRAGHSDRASLFSPINVAAGETAGDIACVLCTVNIQGDVAGDVAVLFGTVNVEPSRTLSGDVAVLFSTLRLDEDVSVHGDLAAFGSTTEIAPTATIQGDRAVAPAASVLGILVALLLLVIGVIWLIVYLVRRNRYPYRA